jgi:hypothetical protein
MCPECYLKSRESKEERKRIYGRLGIEVLTNQDELFEQAYGVKPER